MARKFLFAFLVLMIAYIAPSCNHNKIACPTYADSFPDAKKKKGKKGVAGATGPTGIPSVTKTRSSVLPPGFKD